MADEATPATAKVAWYKRKLVLIIITVLLLGAGGGAAWFMNSSADVAEQAPVEDTKALYVGLSRPFTFAVAAGQRERLVQVEVQLMVRGDKNRDQAQRHLPLMESALLDVFSRQGADRYRTAEGKQAIRQEAISELNTVLTNELGRPLIEKVLFTGIVIQ
ncbi:flagellar basal body-associated FliL family protein [Oceanisphaera sp.]|uniref:flagellar basal body-associated FliL family protein n=1 Tax=Oceanisphaera sp. TaxID=1929979 RepID=UPI003A91A4B1